MNKLQIITVLVMNNAYFDYNYNDNNNENIINTYKMIEIFFFLIFQICKCT